jgi:hypothetical protein
VQVDIFLTNKECCLIIIRQCKSREALLNTCTYQSTVLNYRERDSRKKHLLHYLTWPETHRRGISKLYRTLRLFKSYQLIPVLFIISIISYRTIHIFVICGVVFNDLDAFTAPRFTVTGPPPAAEHTRNLPMTQHADNIWNEGKFLPLFTDHRIC